MSAGAHIRTAGAFAAGIIAATVIPIAAASAQQVATASPCDRIADGAKAIQCRVDALKAEAAEARARGRAADARGAAADAETKCVRTIKAEIAAGRFTTDQLRGALGGQDARNVNACNLLSKLTNG